LAISFTLEQGELWVTILREGPIEFRIGGSSAVGARGIAGVRTAGPHAESPDMRTGGPHSGKTPGPFRSFSETWPTPEGQGHAVVYEAP